jgi:hypothetical protein
VIELKHPKRIQTATPFWIEVNQALPPEAPGTRCGNASRNRFVSGDTGTAMGMGKKNGGGHPDNPVLKIDIPDVVSEDNIRAPFAQTGKGSAQPQNGQAGRADAIRQRDTVLSHRFVDFIPEGHIVPSPIQLGNDGIKVGFNTSFTPAGRIYNRNTHTLANHPSEIRIKLQGAKPCPMVPAYQLTQLSAQMRPSTLVCVFHVLLAGIEEIDRFSPMELPLGTAQTASGSRRAKGGGLFLSVLGTSDTCLDFEVRGS